MIRFSSFFLKTATLLILIYPEFGFSLELSKSALEKFIQNQGGPDVISNENVKKDANGIPVRGETPASIACIYGFTQRVPGCPIHGTTLVPTGGWGIIAVTEGGHDAHALEELNTFSAAFGLPQMVACTPGGPRPCFQEAYATDDGLPPPLARKDALDEHVLDIEWAHAMAPQASILMVEAASFGPSEIYKAVDLASQLVAAQGGGIVSNSWSFPESSQELALDAHFQTPGIVYIASSGDYAAPSRYPASSPYVIAAGGTAIIRDKKGNFVGEKAWRNENFPVGVKLSGSSGGPSMFEPRPSYQNVVSKIVGRSRGTPDISFVADPRSGVDIFVIEDGVGKWKISGGTSLAAPALAGVINSANSRAVSTFQEHLIIYAGFTKNYHAYWNDILIGNNTFPCLAGYDFVTGLGTPQTYKGK